MGNNDGDEDLHKQPGCSGAACYWYQVGCINGCTCSGYEKDIVNGGYYMTPEDAKCSQPKEPTLPEYARTWNIEGKSAQGDWTKYFPWRAPGSSIPLDPCGVFDGFDPPRVSGSSNASTSSYPTGSHGSKVLRPHAGAPANWKTGSVVEVSFGLFVNHGGGYQYRLCPKSSSMTEECFQANVLDFASETTWIRYEDGSGKADVALPVVDVSEGVLPEGSTWRRVPLPACNCDAGFVCGSGSGGGTQFQQYESKSPGGQNTECSTGVQFEAAASGAYGYWVNDKNDFLSQVSLVDHLKVPDVNGDFVLQWRLDCEQTPQIWSSCADVTIGSSGPPAPKPTPTPTPVPMPSPTPPTPSPTPCSTYDTDSKMYTCDSVPTCCDGYRGMGTSDSTVQCLPASWGTYDVMCAENSMPDGAEVHMV